MKDVSELSSGWGAMNMRRRGDVGNMRELKVIIVLLMMGMAAPASAIETKATGGFILSAHGVQFEGN